MMPHDLTIAATGGLLLWFGWYGFNPGQHTLAMGFRRHRPRRHQHDTAALRRWPNGAWRTPLSPPRNGTLVLQIGVPGWTGCHHLPVLLGQPRLALLFWAELLECWSFSARSCWNGCALDDPIGAVPVHGFCGIWGHAIARPICMRQIWRDWTTLRLDNTAPLTVFCTEAGPPVC